MEQRRYACDSCRRRRIRCDTGQPCGNCTRAGVLCTFGSTTSRQSATSYARNLEQQLVDLRRQLDDALLLTAATTTTEAAFAGTRGTHAPPPPHIDKPSSLAAAPPDRPDRLELMVQAGDDFTLQQPTGTVKIYRYSAGVNLLRSVADLLSAGHHATPLGQALFEALETPTSRLPSRAHLDWLAALLPAKEIVWMLASRAMDTALVSHDFLDRAAFGARLDAVFDSPIDVSSVERQSFLALVYALLALGEQYNAPLDSLHSTVGRDHVDVPGLQYFRASRSIIYDEHERVDLDSVAAMMLHSRYLLTISTYSDAHAALSTATSAAMHMGLHLDDAPLAELLTDDELYARRRLFSVLNMIDTYVACLLGLPRALRSASPRQTLGLRNEDLLDEGRSLVARDATCPEAETILTQKLIRIQAKIHDRQLDSPERSRVSKDWIAGVELDFQDWESELPELPDNYPNWRIVLGQMIIRLQYAGTEILFYAPCVHHLAIERGDPAFNADGYKYGSMCVRAATRAVLIIQTLHSNDLLSRAHWLNRYVLAWAAATLIYFVVHSRARVTIDESRKAALMACQMLETLGESNVAARRIHECIAPYAKTVSAAEPQ